MCPVETLIDNFLIAVIALSLLSFLEFNNIPMHTFLGIKIPIKYNHHNELVSYKSINPIYKNVTAA